MIDYAVFLDFTKIFSPIVEDYKSSVLSVSTPLYTFIAEDLLQNFIRILVWFSQKN